MERRERDPDTGDYIIYGECVFDVVTSKGSKIAAKLTGKAAKNWFLRHLRN